MPSPFPGMDPWIEDAELFPDFHDAFLYLVRRDLTTLLPDGYAALLRNRIVVDEDQSREPDTSIVKSNIHIEHATGTAMLVAPMMGLQDLGALNTDSVEETYIDIVTVKGRKLVTAIEMLSPSNKAPSSKGRKSYQQKQKELLEAGINIVEIDLLRAGQSTTLAPRAKLERSLASTLCYHFCVSRTETEGPHLYAAPLGLQDPLPTIAIPLLLQDAPVILDFQNIMKTCYDEGPYAALIDYTRPPTPPLSAEQQTWADEILRAKGVL